MFNALDNLEARRHVNKMCLAADVPLIESGTTGFKGQVQVIKRGRSECYDCNVKETPKTFPVCTIRSTPSQPIHCIVWAKSYLFAEIFGTSEDDASELDSTEDTDNAEEIKNLRHEAQALKRIRDSMGSEDFPRKVFEKVFTEDVERLRSMEEMWRTRKKPDPLNFDKLSRVALAVSNTIATQDQTAWTASENFVVFSSSLRRLSDRLESLRDNADAGTAAPVLAFDKDDKDTLDFVASAANLRSIIFGIDARSEFDIKQMAGNIIPAIATTNAMAAGLCVLQAFKVMRQDYDKARNVYLSKAVDRVIASDPLRPPKPDCPVCGVAQARVEVDLTRATLQDLVDGLLRVQLGYGAELSVSSDAGILFDPELDDNLGKKLCELDIRQDSFLTVVDDEDENPRVNLVLSISETTTLPGEAKPIALSEKIEIARRIKQPAATPKANGSTNGKLASNGASTNGAPGKRKRNTDDEEDVTGLDVRAVKKRGKASETKDPATDDDDILLLMSTGNDRAIVIDD